MLSSVFVPNRNNSFAWMNLVFLTSLLILGKIEPSAVLFGYFLETIIIGLFNIFKMIAASKHDGSGKSIYTTVPFFMFHYGMFVAIQSIFVFVIFSLGSSSFVTEPFNLIDNYSYVLSLKGMEYILPFLFVTQLMKFIFDFIIPEKYLTFTSLEIMYNPYARIFIQQFTVIFAMFFMLFDNISVIAAVLLIVFRAVVDFGLVSIKNNSKFLDYLVEKTYNGVGTKDELKKKYLLISE